jgi:thermitase
VFAACLLPLALLLAQPPDDPLYAQQWPLERLGASCVWERTAGSPGVTVAVVDSGVDLGHPDLVGRLRTDGFDFVDNDGEPWDENGHGTHVAGVIAATRGNGEGGAGLAPGVQILPVRVMDAEGAGSDRAIAAGINYAVDKGARVINLSLGATLLLATPEGSPQVIRAIRNALAADVVVVVAAGNDFVPLPNAIVGENEDVLVVAASDQDDRKAGFSNSGPWVDVSAPGERIVSTMPTYEVYLTSVALPPGERFERRYDSMSGTSQAAPFVSATAALLLSAHPDWTAAQVREAITSYAADIYADYPSYYRRLRLLGSGRLDACASLAQERAAPNPLAALPLVAGAVGLCLVALAGGGLALALARRPRRQPAPPAPAPPAPAPPAHTGDTLVAARAPWGILRIGAGPGAGAALALTGPEVVIGREAGCDLQLLDDPTVSRRHARITLRDGRALVEDLGSSHGTAVDGRPIPAQRPTPLPRGATLTIGRTTLRLE